MVAPSSSVNGSTQPFFASRAEARRAAPPECPNRGETQRLQQCYACAGEDLPATGESDAAEARLAHGPEWIMKRVL